MSLRSEDGIRDMNDILSSLLNEDSVPHIRPLFAIALILFASWLILLRGVHGSLYYSDFVKIMIQSSLNTFSPQASCRIPVPLFPGLQYPWLCDLPNPKKGTVQSF